MTLQAIVETASAQPDRVVPKRSFIHHAAVYWLGRMATLSLSVVLLPLYTACLSPAEYGELSIFAIIVDVTLLTAGLQLPVAVYRFWAKESTERGKRRVLGGAMLLTLAVPALLFLPVYICADSCCLWLDLPGRANLLRLVLLEGQLAMIGGVVVTEMRVRDDSHRVAVLEFSQVTGMAVLSVVFVAGFRLGVWGMFLAQTTVFAAVAVCFLPTFLNRVGLRYDPAVMRDMLRFALPLVPSAVALAALNNADRFFLQRMVGMEATGLYCVGYKFGLLVNMLVLGPFFLIWEPKRFSLAHERNAETKYGEVFTYLLVLTSFVALGLTGLSRELVQMMTAREYRQAYTIVPIVAWAYVFFGLTSVVNVGLFVHHKTATVSWLVVVALLANTAGNLLLIPVWGAHGAALATLLAFFLLFVLDLVFSQRFIAIAFEWRKLALLGGLLLAAGGCMALVPEANLCFGIAVKLLVLSCFLIALLALGFFQRLSLPQRALSLWKSLSGAT